MKIRVDLARNTLHARSWKRVKRPSFGTVLSCCGRFAGQDSAFSPIKACQVTAAGQRSPHESIPVNVNASRKETLFCSGRIIERRLVGFRDAGPPLHADDLSGCARDGAPYNAVVSRIGNDAINTTHLYRLVHLGIDLAIAIDVIVATAPSLRCPLASGLLEYIQIHIREA